MMGLSALPIFVNAGLAPPDDDPPPSMLNCEAQVRAYCSGSLQFTFKVVAVGIVGEIYGNPLLVDCYGFLEGPWDWRSNNYIWDFSENDNGYAGWEENYYNIGGYQRVGYKYTVAFKIIDTSNDEHLVFELSAIVHLWYYSSDYREVSWNIPPEGPEGCWVLKLEDVTKNLLFAEDRVGVLIAGPY